MVGSGDQMRRYKARVQIHPYARRTRKKAWRGKMKVMKTKLRPGKQTLKLWKSTNEIGERSVQTERKETRKTYPLKVEVRGG